MLRGVQDTVSTMILVPTHIPQSLIFYEQLPMAAPMS